MSLNVNGNNPNLYTRQDVRGTGNLQKLPEQAPVAVDNTRVVLPNTTRLASLTAPAKHNTEVSKLSFPEPKRTDSMIDQLAGYAAKNPKTREAMQGNGRDREKVMQVIRTVVEVGRKEGIDPRILFAIALQESEGGLNTSHRGSSATGAMGVTRAAAADSGISYSQAKSSLKSNVTSAAKYLKKMVDYLDNTSSRVGLNDLSSSSNDSRSLRAILYGYTYGLGQGKKAVTNPQAVDNYDRNRNSYSTTVFKFAREMGVKI